MTSSVATVKKESKYPLSQGKSYRFHGLNAVGVIDTRVK
jgi:hypothetical protein